jgi:hypothetical protein
MELWGGHAMDHAKPRRLNARPRVHTSHSIELNTAGVEDFPYFQFKFGACQLASVLSKIQYGT